ncbi:MAG: hypothetical protein ACRD1R_13110 [Acidobacteriota bacterium]
MNERGEGRLGCIFVLLLTIAFVFLAYQVAPVYLDKVEFEEDLSRIIGRAGADNWSSQVIREQILDLAEMRNFKISQDEIQITRSSALRQTPELKVSLTYRRPIELAGYSYTFEFESTSSTFIGRL